MFENKVKGQRSKVKVKINGEENLIYEGATVKEFLEELNIKPQGVAVERNLEIVPKSRYAETVLEEGDKIEIVQMVGGG